MHIFPEIGTIQDYFDMPLNRYRGELSAIHAVIKEDTREPIPT